MSCTLETDNYRSNNCYWGHYNVFWLVLHCVYYACRHYIPNDFTPTRLQFPQLKLKYLEYMKWNWEGDPPPSLPHRPDSRPRRCVKTLANPTRSKKMKNIKNGERIKNLKNVDSLSGTSPGSSIPPLKETRTGDSYLIKVGNLLYVCMPPPHRPAGGMCVCIHIHTPSQIIL